MLVCHRGNSSPLDDRAAPISGSVLRPVPSRVRRFQPELTISLSMTMFMIVLEMWCNEQWFQRLDSDPHRRGGRHRRHGDRRRGDRDQRGFLAWCSLWLAAAWRAPGSRYVFCDSLNIRVGCPPLGHRDIRRGRGGLQASRQDVRARRRRQVTRPSPAAARSPIAAANAPCCGAPVRPAGHAHQRGPLLCSDEIQHGPHGHLLGSRVIAAEPDGGWLQGHDRRQLNENEAAAPCVFVVRRLACGKRSRCDVATATAAPRDSEFKTIARRAQAATTAARVWVSLRAPP